MDLLAAKEYFQQLVNTHQLSHAYLLVGDSLEEKRALTRYLLQSMECFDKGDDGHPCLSCRKCQQIERDQMADWMVVQAEGRTLKVDQIRDLKEWLSTSPVESYFKGAVIEDAELMNASAANALLLFLEEPHDNVYIFLYASKTDALLPTILSRVQQVVIDPSEDNLLDHQHEEAGVLSHHQKILNLFPSQAIHRHLANYQAETFEAWIQALLVFYDRLAQADAQAFVLIQLGLKPYLSFEQAIDGIDFLIWLNSQWILQPYQEESTVQPLIKALESSLKQTLRPPIAGQAFQLDSAFYESKRMIQANVSGQLAYEQLAIKTCQWQ